MLRLRHTAGALIVAASLAGLALAVPGSASAAGCPDRSVCVYQNANQGGQQYNFTCPFFRHGGYYHTFSSRLVGGVSSVRVTLAQATIYAGKARLGLVRGNKNLGWSWSAGINFNDRATSVLLFC